MQDCVFCKIVAGEISAEKEYEDDLVIGFKDRKPMADIHLLFVPKVHVSSLGEVADANILSKTLTVLRDFAKKMNIVDYKVLVNNGRFQSVPHMHFHLLGGTLKGVI
jgi:histidine triad (HIT) family protein